MDINLFIEIWLIYAVFFHGSGCPADFGRQLLVNSTSKQLHATVSESLHKMVAQVDGILASHGLGGANDIGGYHVGSARQGLDDYEREPFKAAGQHKQVHTVEQVGDLFGRP